MCGVYAIDVAARTQELSGHHRNCKALYCSVTKFLLLCVFDTNYWVTHTYVINVPIILISL